MVSIHAFRGEGDAERDAEPRALDVSIHAFRGEGDSMRSPQYSTAAVGFNPRLPGGRRHGALVGVEVWKSFQSTPSGGKATAISRAAVPCFRQIL